MENCQKYHIQQVSTSDNGVVCLKSVLRYLGVEVSLQKLRDLIGCQVKPSSLLDILKLSRMIGLEGAGFKGDLEFLQGMKTPGVLLVNTKDKENVFIVYYGFDGDKYWIGNPEKPEVVACTPEEVAVMWSSRYILVLDKAEVYADYSSSINSFKEWCLSFIRPDLNLLKVAGVLGVLLAVLGSSSVFYLQSKLAVWLNNTASVGGSEIIVLFLLSVTMLSLNFVQSFFLLRQAQDVSVRFQTKVYSDVMSMPKQFFNRQMASTVTRRFSFELESAFSRLSKGILTIPFFLISIIVFISVTNGAVGVVCLLAALLMFFLFLNEQVEIDKITSGEILAIDSIGEFNSESFKNSNSIKLSGKLNRWKSINEQKNTYFQSIKFDVNWLDMTRFFRIKIIGLITFFVCFLLIIKSVLIYSNVAIGLINILLVGGFLYGLQCVFSLLKVAKSFIFELTRIYDYSLVDNIGENKSDLTIVDEFDTLSLDQLSYKLPNNKFLLSDITFEVRKGEKVAIVGQSGSGKTVICDMIQNAGSYFSGKVYADGISIANIKKECWQAKIALVTHKVDLFRGTLIDNITLEELGSNKDRLDAMLFDYGFHQYFSQLPNGYKTILGTSEVAIPDGIRQLIGLARALWQEPSLLLLDEATSGMSAEMIEYVSSVLQKANSGMAILIFSSTTDLTGKANRTYYLENGILDCVENKNEPLSISNDSFIGKLPVKKIA